MCSAKALSRYSELVDDLIRQKINKLEAAANDGRMMLREWELPELLDALDSSQEATSSDDLQQKLRGVQQTGGRWLLNNTLAKFSLLCFVSLVLCAR